MYLFLCPFILSLVEPSCHSFIYLSKYPFLYSSISPSIIYLADNKIKTSKDSKEKATVTVLDTEYKSLIQTNIKDSLSSFVPDIPGEVIHTYQLICAPLPQRAYVALHSSLFGPDGAVNCDYIVTNSINSGLCIPMVHTITNVEPIGFMYSNGAHNNQC